ncbi:calcineurin-like phosphoesterase C-terminal domain-containing protein [Sphingobacterium sp. N143]|uniref:calcineurin-like phosphoesterase C-terminal domain-containing protein n=1 Tax=Sphingobacterium sp. N143 TaxID=2746727 RepID=UPI00257643A9|nr:calcineurin-like phosphoesterase C-terminal domain-containing protein [Sphingobacterium sp. N143]MDM1294493.1 calcineurin-like phosphoesterase C-terminal domain-containing protein [Sphingobacterium sp. N143]
MKTFLALAISWALAQSVQAQELAKGKVYHDVNKNGKLDKKEKGIAAVSVSNGREVVVTDKDGNYQLPIGKDNIIFVVKPAGYAVPLDENNHPKFYYIHKAIGSPASKYPGISATGDIPAAIDFALYQQDENPSFSAFVFGDPQAYTEEELRFFKEGVINEISDKSIAKFGISLGDLVGDDLSLQPKYKSVVSTMGLPWYNVMGNHDMNYDATVDSLSDESFERTFGPNNYAFNYGNTHFIVLDDIIYPNPRTGKGYLGGFRKDQLDFVENDLKQVDKNKLIVLAFHIPLYHEDSDVFRNEDRQRLFDILAPFQHTLSLSAHTHFQRQYFYGQADGWKQGKAHHEYNVGTTSGDWYSGELNEKGIPVSTMRDGTPKGYAVLKIDGNQYSFDYKVVGKPETYQIELYGASVVPQKYTKRYPIYANFFIGKEGDKVSYRINQGEWKNMRYVNEHDPAFLTSLAKYDTANELMATRRPSNPEKSSHLWMMNLPKLKVGKHQIEIRAVDMFNREHVATKDIVVE